MGGRANSHPFRPDVVYPRRGYTAVAGAGPVAAEYHSRSRRPCPRREVARHCCSRPHAAWSSRGRLTPAVRSGWRVSPFGWPHSIRQASIRPSSSKAGRFLAGSLTYRSGSSLRNPVSKRAKIKQRHPATKSREISLRRAISRPNESCTREASVETLASASTRYMWS